MLGVGEVGVLEQGGVGIGSGGMMEGKGVGKEVFECIWKRCLSRCGKCI